ncbi:MAG: bifunctional phosphopantothenoylcysteine decarboxylase/phosphopantothenate--cysteine ligase CoaBC [Streptosporangiaceae bacterium]|nr:bifunctional phosphopantothenoylcysteine decarboxylase/phosphopantothenate--cysteine ligase CoaBC [Streptosporangiaceae bacterium]MBV9855160.1 bifunctional phosphopantothenoylcysteine decarboxylase/phosphopantothenate--cysteine ligase CoaBC [Streptosporangiaceae bacterium]
MARVVLGVGAGIAAYKACELLRLLREAGHQVRVVPTPDALRFVGEPTWAALSGEPVTTDVWAGVSEVPHIRLGQSADLVMVAPATADLLARAAAGMASDLLTATLLTARCPVVYAPAMHTEMWEHPATVANVSLLRSRGAVVLDPAVGRLTGADSGAGRLPEPQELFGVAVTALRRGQPDLAGRRVVVSAGGTREELDPVRFLGNWSTGRQGYALARSAAARGADVTVVAANVELADPAGSRVRRVVSARDMHAVMLAEAAAADVIVMTAAVADFRPAARSDSKIKKDGRPPEPIRLTENPDILAELSARRAPDDQIVVGFAAETEADVDAARGKLARKGCDLLVVNPVGNGRGFGSSENEAVVLGADGTSTPIPRGSKEALADAVWDLVAARLKLPAPALSWYPAAVIRHVAGLLSG